jgi:hypothetical protein
MSKKLLIETQQFKPNPVTITEGLKNGGNIFVEGVLATVEVKNGNGRYYKKDLWEREIENFQKKISQTTTETCGELDHPDSQVINLKNASHAIKKIWWDGDEVMGLIEVFCDPGYKGTNSGRIAGALISNGLTIGVSSRGMGSLKQMGEVMEVQDDFELLTWDLVSNPSNPDSWMVSNSLNEGKSSSFNSYSKVDSIVTEILCSKGSCPTF